MLKNKDVVFLGLLGLGLTTALFIYYYPPKCIQDDDDDDNE